MDIWNWYYQELDSLYSEGYENIADQIKTFVEGRFSKDKTLLESNFSTLRNFTRQHKKVWLEILIRQQRIHAYISEPEDFRNTIDDAIDLIALAHSDKGKDCPHSICAINNFNTLFSYIDPNGSAQQRLTLAEEQLEKIQKNISCYSCMVHDKMYALCDLDRYDESYNTFIAAKKDSDYFRDEANIKEHHFRSSMAAYAAKPMVWGSHIKEGLDLLNKMKPNNKRNKHLVKCLKLVGLIRQAPYDLSESQTLLDDVLGQGTKDIDYTHLIEVMPLAIELGLEVNNIHGQKLFTKIAHINFEYGRIRDAFNAAHQALYFFKLFFG